MYEAYYGLTERPFELGTNGRFLFLPEPHREALCNLHYGIESRKGVTVLTGEVGTGKTTLVRAAISRIAGPAVCLHLTNPRITRDEFFEFLTHGFDLPLPPHPSKVACLVALETRLTEHLHRGTPCTVIIDEAQSLSDELIEEVRLLTNLEASGARLLSIVLVGQPEFAQRLNDPALRHLKQRVALRCELRPLTLQETAGYVANRIRAAGGIAAAVFTREAVACIYEVSHGIPRVISVLCDNALVTGFAANEKPIGSRLIRDVCQDFYLDSPPEKGTAAPTDCGVERKGAFATAASLDGVRRVVNEDESREAPVSPLFADFGRRRRFGIF